MLFLFIDDFLDDISSLCQLFPVFLSNLLDKKLSFEVVRRHWDHHEGNDVKWLQIELASHHHEEETGTYVKGGSWSPKVLVPDG